MGRRRFTFRGIKHVGKFFWKVQHWRRKHSDTSIRADDRLITPQRFLTSCDVQHSHSEGSDLTGSNTAEAEEDADPSNEAEDRSC